MNNGFKWNMLITSYLPLWISIILIDLWTIIKNAKTKWNEEIVFLENIIEVFKVNILPIISIVIISIICIISCIMVSKFLNKQRSGTNYMRKITNVKKNSNLSIDFLISYILPMLVFDFTSLLHIILFVLYFSTLAFLCIRNNHVYVNIFLELGGYKIYTADVECSIINGNCKYTESLIISKNDLVGAKEKKIIVYDFDKKIYIDLTED